MGHDIVTIGRHTLDTSNLHTLADDVAHRLQANIIVEYQDAYSNYVDGKAESTYDAIIIGEIKIPGATAVYSLRDEYYQLRKYYEEYGDKLFEMQYLKGNEMAIECAKQELSANRYELSLNDEEGRYVNIDNDTIDIDFFYYSRWWDFCRRFTTENEWDKEFTDINNFRQNLKKAINSFGGNEMVYLDDQGETGHLTNGFYTWQQIQDVLQTKFKEQVLNVSSFMKNKNLRKDGDYPLAFYDDFSDLL